ncbi:MAG: hypothetical protein AAGC46_00705 [Solirubrobacteraceae bacterium]|nr:hypothetical protein [Patulibacter sp.]
MTLVGFELRRIIGRSGSFFGVMVVALGIAVLFAALGNASDQTADHWTSIIGTPLVFGATVVGALAGSYDVAQGTMRYLVLTGVPRWKLVAIRAPALVLAIAIIAIPALIVGIVATSSGPDSAGDIARGLVAGVFYAAVWGLVAMAIGTLLRSNGAGIAVALVLYLLSGGITLYVRAKVSETVGNYLLPDVVSVVAEFGHRPIDDRGGDGGPGFSTMPYGAAVAALVIWIIVIVGLAVARAERDEY